MSPIETFDLITDILQEHAPYPFLALPHLAKRIRQEHKYWRESRWPFSSVEFVQLAEACEQEPTRQQAAQVIKLAGEICGASGTAILGAMILFSVAPAWPPSAK